MRKTFFNIMTAALLAVILLTGFVLADGLNKYRTTYTDIDGNDYYAFRDGRYWGVDTLYGLAPDTITIRKKETCKGYNFAFKLDSTAYTAATDSFRVFVRPVFIDTEVSAANGSALIPLLLRSSTGDSAYLTDWESGSWYWIEDYTPPYSKLCQLILYGSAEDTIPVKYVIEQITEKSW